MPKIKAPSIKLPSLHFPILSIPDEPLAATTQEFLPIADITDNLVLFRDGGAALIMESTSLNFSLLSENEQEAVIAAYAALINSVSFAIQIVVRTKRKDIAKYLDFLDQNMESASTPKLKGLMVNYRKFIEETITTRNVLEKRFLLVIPFFPFELGVQKSFALTVSKKDKGLPYPKSYIIEKAKIVLYPRRDNLERQAARVGLRLTQLKDDELIRLYHDIYNPEKEAVKDLGQKEFNEETI